MNKLLLPLVALLVGGVLGAIGYALVTPEPERAPVAAAPEPTVSDQDDSAELAALREENQRLAGELADARAAKPETPASEKPKPEKPTQPKPDVIEPTEEPEPLPEPGSASPEESLRRILGREPLSEELEEFKKWLAHTPPDPSEVTTAISNGDADTMLKLLAKNRDVSVMDALKDGAKFGSLFRRKTPDVFLTLEQAQQQEKLPDGAVIDIPHGVHTLDLDKKYRAEFPRDILIRGAGKDATLLRINTMSAREGLQQLHFENLTLDCDNGSLTDLRRNAPSTIRANNVRFVRFDSGAGGSCLLSARSMAFFASDCEFTNGFGGSPGSGTPFQSIGILLVRVENSTFIGPMRNIFEAREYQASNEERYGQGECYFTGCKFIDCKPEEIEDVKTENCTVELNRPEEVSEEDWAGADDKGKLSFIRNYAPNDPKPLTDINQMWRE